MPRRRAAARDDLVASLRPERYSGRKTTQRSFELSKILQLDAHEAVPVETTICRFFAVARCLRDHPISKTMPFNSNSLAISLAAMLMAFAWPSLAAQAESPAQNSSVISKQSVRAPNIILIFADDLGYGEIGVYNQNARLAAGLPALRTPNLDRLAAQGMRLTSFYAAPACAPSRAALMTGLHNGHSFIRGNESSVNLRREDRVIPELLKASGYKTAMFGKWGLGESDETLRAPTALRQIAMGDAQPLRKGFDEFFGYLSHTAAHFSYAPELLSVKGFRLWDTFTNQLVAIEPPSRYVPDLVAERALEFIERNVTNKFFLYLPITPPHANASMNRIDVPEVEPEYAGKNWPETEKRFASLVTRMDRHVGLILNKLTELHLDENTVVIFTSDNGAHAAANHDYTFFNSTGPLRGRKFSVYEGGIRVPFLARWPTHIPAGVANDHLAAVWDLLPTFCELSHAESLPGIDGISMLPTLLNQNSNQVQHAYLYWETPPDAGGLKSRAARNGHWKSVRKDKAALELYNLSTDPEETTNAAPNNPTVVAQMDTIFNNASTATGTGFQTKTSRSEGGTNSFLWHFKDKLAKYVYCSRA